MPLLSVSARKEMADLDMGGAGQDSSGKDDLTNYSESKSLCCAGDYWWKEGPPLFVMVSVTSTAQDKEKKTMKSSVTSAIKNTNYL